jgi:3-oxoacyl-[acyl-carrier-protein] synthase III
LMIKSRFESIGVLLPEKIVTTRELIDGMKTKPQFDLESLTGIISRRWRADHDDSYTLATEAVRRCLEHSCYKASDMDVIIFCSVMRFMGGLNYYLEPSMSTFLKNNLGFRQDAMNFDITNACAGMLTGVQILDNMIRSGMARTGMIVSGECITPFCETALKEIRNPIDEQFASLTMGDAGVALIMDRSADEKEGIDFVEFMTVAEFSGLCQGMPSIENSGMAMYTDAMGIHREVILRLPKILAHLIKKYGVSAADYDIVIPHQTSTRAIATAFDVCRERIEGIPDVLTSLDRYGNTASTSHFVVLHDHMSEKKIKERSRVLFIGIASGIVLGYVSATMKNLELQYGYNN